MQIAVTQRRRCEFEVFTNSVEDMLVVRVMFYPIFWGKLKEKLFNFHSEHNFRQNAYLNAFSSDD
jgi:hypothetical protein